MKSPQLTLALAFVLAGSATAQQAGEVFASAIDAAPSASLNVGGRGPCGSGLTTTLFTGTVGQAGNMFDIAPSVDMTIECIDMNMQGSGPIDVEVWYCPITAVGNGTNPGAWTQLANVTGVIPAGQAVATQLDVSGNGVVFSAGQTYGIYVFIQNYVGSATGIVWYGSPGLGLTYAGDHCSVTTLYGSQMNWMGIYNPRDWNGTLHTELAGPAGPSLSITGSCPGPVSVDCTGMTPGGPVVLAYGVTVSNWPLPSGRCIGAVIPLVNPVLVTAVFADGNGNVNYAANPGPNACGLVHALAFDVATCTPTNSVAL